MGFFDKVEQMTGGGNKQKNFKLSPLGNDKLTKITASGAEYIILSAIKRHEPCNVDELVKDPQIKYGYEQIRDTCNRFFSSGWIVID